MTVNRPSGQNSQPNGVPPTPRRSARQERLAQRGSSRSLARASTSRGPDRRPILVLTGLFAVIAVVVVAAAYIASQPKAISSTDLITPSTLLTTPSSIPSNGGTLGDPNAPVTLTIWSDFRCTGCFQFTSEREPQVVANYVKTGKVKLVYKDFLTIDSNQPGTTASRDAANAAWCAADQGKFWTMHDWLFANQDPQESPTAFTIDRLLAIGKAAGMDTSRFNPCVQNGSHLADIAAEKAPSDAGFTPATYITDPKTGKDVQVLGPADPSTGNPTPARYEDLVASFESVLAGGPVIPVASGSPIPVASGSPGASVSPSVAPVASPSAS